MGSSLTARLPQIDFTSADPNWLPCAPHFAHRQNGASLLLPYLEPFLIRVMRAARPAIEKAAPHLLDDLDVFNRQEANHYRVHAAYNRRLLDEYPGLDAYEAEIKRDFEGFLPERGLAWCLAYSEGFESTGMAFAELVLEEMHDLLEEGDPSVVELWRWHLAEEFEHRSVVHDVLAVLYPGWWRRVQGVRFCGTHLFGFTGRVSDFMLELDIERGRLPAAARDLPTERTVARTQGRFMAPRMARVLLPGYDPARRITGPRTQQVLASYA